MDSASTSPAAPADGAQLTLEQLVVNMHTRMNDQASVLHNVVQELVALRQQTAQPIATVPPPQPAMPLASTPSATPHTSLVKAVERVKLPQYSGERDSEELDTWIFQLERYFDFFPQASQFERIELAGIQLKGQAATWWRDIHKTPAGRPITWADFTAAIMAMFMPVNREQLARDRLANARQRDKDSVAQYTTYMRRLFLSVSTLTPADMAHRYIYGLKKDLRKDVAMADPHTFEEAAAVAARLEALSRTFNRPDTWSQQQPKRNTHGPQPMELGAVTKPVNKGQARAPYYSGNNGQRNASVCFYCKEKGHFKRDCPKLKAKERAGNDRGR